MSVITKRTIWRGPADRADKPFNVEGIATQADILPGMILSASGSGLAKNAVAATVFGQPPIIADKDQMKTKSVDDVWLLNDSMVAMRMRPSEPFNALVITGQALVAEATALSRSATPGVLKIALTNGTEEIVAYADETVTTTGTQLVAVYAA